MERKLKRIPLSDQTSWWAWGDCVMMIVVTGVFIWDRLNS